MHVYMYVYITTYPPYFTYKMKLNRSFCSNHFTYSTEHLHNLFSMNNRKLNSSHYCQSLIWTVLTSLSKPYLHFSLFFLVSKVKSLWFYYFSAWPCSNVARCTLRLCCRRHSSWTSCYRGVRFRCSRWFSTWGSGAGKGTRWWWFLLSVPCGSLTR